MLTDTEARDLLQSPAATIEVEPDHPLPLLGRPRLWPMLVAAAAVVAVVVTTLALADRGTAPQPSTTPTPTPEVNRIPPVMGLDPDDAVAMLSKLDVDVELVNTDECVTTPVVAGSSPPNGARFDPGATVKLTVLRPDPMAFCGTSDPDSAWQLLRFALGVDSPPPFADQVTLYPGGGEPVVLSATESADPANWEVCNGDLCGSALSILAAAATTPSSSSPVLTTQSQPPAMDACTNAEVKADSYLGITVMPPTDGISLCPMVTAYYSETGALEAVAIPLFPEDEGLREPTGNAAAAAEAFVGWARGSGVPPAFADEVRYLVNDAVVRTMAGANATRRGRWRVCYSGVPLGCPSPFKTLKYFDGQVVQSSTPATSCVNRTGELPGGLAELELVRLDQPEAENCRDAFAIEIWVDGDGRIAAINHLPGSEAGPVF